MLHLYYYVNYDFSRALKSTMIFILSIVRTKLKGLKQCIIFSSCCNGILSYYATCFNKTLPDLTLKSLFSCNACNVWYSCNVCYSLKLNELNKN